MPIDVALLAGTIVAKFLMPYAKKGAKKIAEEVTKKVNKAASKHLTGVTKKIWERVTDIFKSEKVTMEDFKDDPETWEKPIEKRLREKLGEDSKLVQELSDLVKAEGPKGVGNSLQIIANTVGYVDARHAEISGGIVAGIYQSGEPSSESQPKQKNDTGEPSSESQPIQKNDT